jgi:GNAT superfamily N-acetyltransferase
MISLREAQSDVELAAWAAVKAVVVPNEPVTPEELRRTDEPGRLLLLAERDGATVGHGIAARSSFVGRAFVLPRVLPDARRSGVGTTVLEALCLHAVALDLAELQTFVDVGDPDGLAFAFRFGFVDVDAQLEQVRVLDEEIPPPMPSGITIVAVADRPELLEASFALAREAYADMPLPGPIEVTLEEWLRDEATLPEASFVAFAGDEIVGYAGLLRRGGAVREAEHGLTAVRSGYRRRGIASTLKRAQLTWAARNGIERLVTWTQRGNEDMQRLNASLGYVTRSKLLTMRAPRDRVLELLAN